MTFGDDTTELFAKDLKTLLTDTAEGLELEPDAFVVKYTNKGKEFTVKTENNFKIMVSKPPNDDGVFECRVELKDKKPAAEAEEVKTEPVKPPAPVYNNPGAGGCAINQVADHF